ncbi:vitelline membrane outer layer protein 1-like [Mercenaria mercenaria]|uniref:vitelline membrane outer layer protein 1-like n=1 Tax=Mercenaria mercenaria TaxID=6596 RepID=UPI00234FA12B|nr:vitelline membrane outer layer protein 1-like [Mercenaria mercenaria]
MKYFLSLLVIVASTRYGSSIGNLNTTRTVVKELTVSNGGNYGFWTPEQFCPEGTFALGYNMKIEGNQFAGDDTALNAIRLICGDLSGHLKVGADITSGTGPFGTWEKTETCNEPYHDANFLTAFALQVEAPQGSGDDTSANYVKFYCRDLDGHNAETELVRAPGVGYWGSFGEWSQSCDNSTAICGLATKVEPVQGGGDDTSLNDAVFYCCELKENPGNVVGK